MAGRGRGSDDPGRRELRIARIARIDRDRFDRTGAPEVVLAEGKSTENLLRIVQGLSARGLGAFVSRPTPSQIAALRGARRRGIRVRPIAGDRLYRLAGPVGGDRPLGRVAVLTAGTADIPVAEEAIALLRAMGAGVTIAHDVGVAGIARLERALARCAADRPRVYLVFAGREGALPTVVAGLVRAPVVGVPTSTGYGRGGRGEAALLAMLQSCAPVAVVNIDAAIPAALFALQLLAAGPRRTGPAGAGSVGRRARSSF